MTKITTKKVEKCYAVAQHPAWNRNAGPEGETFGEHNQNTAKFGYLKTFLKGRLSRGYLFGFKSNYLF